MNLTQIENKEKKIKNINIYFDKNKKLNKNQFENNNKIKLNNNKPNSEIFISDKLEQNKGNLFNQKYSIRNKYKMKRKIENI